jgi:hypothetical protein
MGRVNKYGLSRDSLSEPVKREVRQRCGFGCVRCGLAIYQYHHFDPPFSEAKTHNPSGIALLCGTCHDLVTKGLLSDNTVRKLNRNPKCFEAGFSYGPFDIGDQHPLVTLGYSTWIHTQIILQVFEMPLLKVEPPEVAGTPFRLSGLFYDESGKLILQILQNEWKGPISNWDIEVKGQRIIVRRAPGQIALQIRSDPPNRLIIERLDMFYKGAHILGEEGKHITAIAPDGSIIQGIGASGVAIDGPSIQARNVVTGAGCQSGVVAHGSGIQTRHVTGIRCQAGIVVLREGVIYGRNCGWVSME